MLENGSELISNVSAILPLIMLATDKEIFFTSKKDLSFISLKVFVVFLFVLISNACQTLTKKDFF